MATQYTSLLGFALPVTGELSGTWGDTVNDQITELVEDAIAGSSTKDITGADWTLTTTGSGSTNEARSAILITTGTPGTARNIVAPSQSKAYIVSNQSDSTVTIKGSATTGVAVAAGTEALVAWDGSDFVNVSVKPAGSNTQVQYNNNGVLGASSALTFDGTTLATTTVDATNLEVTNLKAKDGTAAGSIADSTGVVTLASSVLTTTDINGGTIDGATIGGATPGLITGTTITANTAVATDTINEKTTAAGVTIDSVLLKDDVVNATDVEVGTISANDGTQAATIANSTGVMTIASSVLTTTDINGGTIDGATIGGSSAAAITGTTITGTSFVSSGDMTFGDNDKAIFGAGSDLQIYHDGTNSYVKDAGAGYLVLGGQDTGVAVQNGSGQNLILTGANAVTLSYGNAPKLATTSTGIDVTGTVTADGLTVEQNAPVTVTLSNTAAISSAGDPYASIDVLGENGVGTGFADYGARFQVTHDPDLGTSTRGAAIRLWTGYSSAAARERLRINAQGDVSFYEDTGTTPKFFWDASEERLGIGTSSPAYLLDVQKSSAGSAIRIYDNTATSPNPTLYFQRGTTATWGADNYTDYKIEAVSGDFAISSGETGVTTERMRIDSSGNVGIGTSSPYELLTVRGEGTSLLLDTNSSVDGTYSSIAWNGSTIDLSPEASCEIRGYRVGAGATGALAFHTRNSSTSTERMRIDSSGNVGIGTDSPASRLNIVGSYHGQLILQNTLSDSAVKGATFNGAHYTNAEEPLLLGATYSNSTENVCYYGGGWSAANTATSLQFYTAANNTTTTGSERMRIDSSGNVLVGTTTAVDKLTVSGDAYVSGGIHLGGTGAANYLDDYEEGTWTPIYEPVTGAFGSVTYDTQTAYYTKVGQLVTCTFLLRTDAITVGTASGGVRVGGLPFISITPHARILNISYSNAFSGEHPAAGYASGANDYVNLSYRTAADGSLSNSLDVTDLGTGANANYIIGSVIYYAD